MKTPPYRGLGAGHLLNRRVIAWDTETYRMPTYQYEKSTYMVRKAPRLVCVTFAGRGRFTPLPDALVALEAEGKALVQRDGVAWKAIVLADDGAEVMRGLLNDPSTTLVAHNAPFDFGVLADHDNTMLTSIFRAYAEGRVLDTAVRGLSPSLTGACRPSPPSACASASQTSRVIRPADRIPEEA